MSRRSVKYVEAKIKKEGRILTYFFLKFRKQDEYDYSHLYSSSSNFYTNGFKRIEMSKQRSKTLRGSEKKKKIHPRSWTVTLMPRVNREENT